MTELDEFERLKKAQLRKRKQSFTITRKAVSAMLDVAAMDGIAKIRAIDQAIWDKAEAAEIEEGGSKSGWYGPPKGDHTGEEDASDNIIDKLIDNNVTGAEREGIKNSLRNVPEEHLDSLAEITTRTPKTYRNAGTYFENLNGGRVTGVYVRREHTIYIHPDIARQAGSTTILHELGHHITRNSSGWNEGARKVIEDIRQKDSYSNFGLRKYSIKGPREFLADAYVVWSCSPSNWNKLREHARSVKGERYDLEKLFGR